MMMSVMVMIFSMQALNMVFKGNFCLTYLMKLIVFSFFFQIKPKVQFDKLEEEATIYSKRLSNSVAISCNRLAMAVML